MNLNGIAELDDTTSPAGDPLEPCLKAQTGFDGIVGKSADLRHVLRLVDTVARGGATVLLLGEPAQERNSWRAQFTTGATARIGRL